MSTFVDSNIWLYALGCSDDEAKSAAATPLIKRPSLNISTQVINEVCANLRRKKKTPEAELIGLIRRFQKDCIIHPVNVKSMLKASALRERYSLSFYDSQIVACALLAGCSLLESEDMDDGMVIENTLTIRNPLK